MKKLIAFVMAALVCLTLCSCKLGKSKTSAPETETQAYFYVYVAPTTNNGDAVNIYTVDLNEVEVTEGAFSVLKYLQAEYELTFEYSDSEYGAFLTAVGNVRPSAANEFVLIYTTYEADFSLPPYDTKVSIGAVTFTAAGVGASSMTVSAGNAMLITLGSY